ncbi:NEDD8-conjugating enzyme UBE2F [Taenia crassiceps]|uniref:NEDD8-conjugating enzyme UBE2F n=1 Tax=Taenia crassiceps TaxID=6207 RepID=A0ABR4QTQ9_9CEST
MLRLADKIRQRQQGQISNEPDSVSSPSIRNASIRDRLLAQELTDLKSNLSNHCRLRYPDPDKLHEFEIIISPVDGFWAKGHFHFEFTVPEGYNHVPPIVKCTTKIWHPNIDEEGRICLSLLRPSSLDASGWAPTRKLSEATCRLSKIKCHNFLLIRSLKHQTNVPPKPSNVVLSSQLPPAATEYSPYKMNLDLLESRVSELERLIFGVSAIPPQVSPVQTISDLIADAQKQLSLAEKYPKIKEILERSSELRKYMDPNFLDDQAVANAAKIKIILSFEAEILRTAQALEALQSLKSVLTHPAYSDLSSMKAKFAAMQQKHAEQEVQTADFIGESSQLLETYANTTRDISKLLVAWQKKVAAK